MKRKIKLGFSSCPNDTFIFDALVHQKIDTGNFEFEPVIADVEKLNKMAFEGQLEMTKLSYHAFLHLLGKYELLNAGSALGNNCGPLLIALSPLSQEQIVNASIAIPGALTTANFLLSFAYPQVRKKTEKVFSEIETAILDGEVDAGVIIHENRFTYQQKGLIKIMDLGEYWETETKLPIPLGGIAVQSDLSLPEKLELDRIMRESVQYAFEHPRDSKEFVKFHAQEMEESVMNQHISLYVNAFTLDLGEKGRAAVEFMADLARKKQIINNFDSRIFIN
ncbi:MAG TPA: 1,4-dihydroxy-6-naphthoate synthase [Saprospiraceae bacterium]|nr:1,4-dihydroxy-6-naphthoate synthase [Saprospiraceae bacterium]